MKPPQNLATKLGSFGLGTPKVSFRPVLQRIQSRKISSSQFARHTLSIRTLTRASAKLRSSHQQALQFIVRHKSTMPAANFSPGSEGPEAEAALAGLLAEGGGRWTLTADGRGIERNFKFKTFTKTWDFMTAVSLQCKIKNHHPEWSNVYNTTFIRWTTHSPRGLSTKDLALAEKCDALAKDFGEIFDGTTAKTEQQQPETDSSPSTLTHVEQPKPEKPAGLSNLADQAVEAAGGDCGCGPAKPAPKA